MWRCRPQNRPCFVHLVSIDRYCSTVDGVPFVFHGVPFVFKEFDESLRNVSTCLCKNICLFLFFLFVRIGDLGRVNSQ